MGNCRRILDAELADKVAGNFLLSLRMTGPSFQGKVQQFIKRVIAPFRCAYPNPERITTINDSIYPEQKFHIKLFTLALYSPDNVAQARTALRETSKMMLFVPGEPITVHMQDIRCRTPYTICATPRVSGYALDAGEPLIELVEALYSKFAEFPGLLVGDIEEALIPPRYRTKARIGDLDFDPCVTILDSTGLAQDPNVEDSSKCRLDDLNFDRLALSNFDFGRVECEVVELSSRDTELAEDGYYAPFGYLRLCPPQCGAEEEFQSLLDQSKFPWACSTVEDVMPSVVSQKPDYKHWPDGYRPDLEKTK